MTDDQKLTIGIAVFTTAFTTIVSIICAFITKSPTHRGSNTSGGKNSQFLKYFSIMTLSTMTLICFSTRFYGRLTFNEDLSQLGWQALSYVLTATILIWLVTAASSS